MLRRSIIILSFVLLFSVHFSAYAEINLDIADHYLDIFNEYCSELDIPIRGIVSGDPGVGVNSSFFGDGIYANSGVTLEKAILGPTPNSDIQIFYIPHEDNFTFFTGYYESDIDSIVMYTDQGTYYPTPIMHGEKFICRTGIRFTTEEIVRLITSSNVRFEFDTKKGKSYFEFSPSFDDLIIFSSYALLDCCMYSDPDSDYFLESKNLEDMKAFLEM